MKGGKFMSVISVLDKYISGDFIGGNDMLSKDYIDNIIDSEESEINSLLFDFRQKNLNFFVMDTIFDIEEAKKCLKNTNLEQEKYIYSLYILKFLNPIMKCFVDKTLERIGV